MALSRNDEMSFERWQKAKDILNVVSELAPSEQEAYLAEACGQDQALYLEVKSLLESLSQAGSFLKNTSSPDNDKDRTTDSSRLFFSSGDCIADRFQIVELTGRGGMGEVYKAIDQRLDELIALKMIRPEVLSSHTMARFRQEVMLARRVTHPNVCRVFDLEQCFSAKLGCEIVFLTMEFLDGKTLQSHLSASGPLAPTVTLPIIQQMAQALAASHVAGVVHRDLKPANVMLVPEPNHPGNTRVVITDFGIARLAEGLPGRSDPSSPMTTEGFAVGTAAYMAPEQIEAGKITAATDIYALGLIMYEMLAGCKPFGDDLFPSGLARRLKGPPPSPKTHVPELSDGLESLVMSCLATGPDQRIQDDQLVAQITEEQRRTSAKTTGEFSVATPEKPLQTPTSVEIGPDRGSFTKVPANRLIKAKKWSFAWIGLAVVVLGFLSWQIVRWRSEAASTGQRPMVLVGDFENRTGELVFDKSLHEMFTASLEQSRFVEVFPASRVADVLQRMGQSSKRPIDESTGLEILQREDLQGVLLGSIVRLGQKYVLIARVEGPQGVNIASAEASATTQDEIPAGVDTIVESLRRKLGESLQSLRETSLPLAKVSSPSVEAVRYYTLGKENLYQGDLNQAVLMLSRAVELDPKFAMAHAYLGVTYAQLRDSDRRTKQFREAANLADKVSEPERLRITANYYDSLLDFKKECDAHQLLSQLQPQDATPYVNLGYCEMEQRNYPQAVTYTEKALQFVPRSRVRINLAEALLLQGDLTRALQVAQSVSHDFKNDLSAQSVLAHIYMAQNRTDEARQIFKSIIQAGGYGKIEGNLFLADLAAALGQYREAEAGLRAVIFAADLGGYPGAAIRARSALEELLLSSNSSQLPARQVLSHFDRISDDPMVNFLQAKAYAQSGQLTAASQGLRAIDLAIQEHDAPALQAMRSLVSAEIALAQKRFVEAAALAQRAVQYQNSAFAVETLARCYAAAGMNAEAARQYEVLLSRTAELVDDQVGNLEAPAFRLAVNAHYHLGVLYHKLGRGDDARTHLRHFLDDWSHADPGIPIHEHAQRLLRELMAAGMPTPAR